MPRTTTVASRPDAKKLRHLVAKYSVQCNNNAEEVRLMLVRRHREYQMRNADELLDQIVALINDNNNINNETDDDEEEALRLEEQRRDTSGNALNDMLRQGIQQARQEQEQQQQQLQRKKKKRRVKPPETDTNNNNNNWAFLTPLPRPHQRYTDLGGLQRHNVWTRLSQWLSYPIRHAVAYRHLWPTANDKATGCLLKGPPGTGKTHLAHAAAAELNVTTFHVTAGQLVAGVTGESEERIRRLMETAAQHAPSLILLDDIDVWCSGSKRGSSSSSSSSMETRMMAQFVHCWDTLLPRNVVILAATNRPEALDPTVRRRFGHEIALPVPDEAARKDILLKIAQSVRFNKDENGNSNIDWQELTRLTPGYVGADVQSLVQEAVAVAIHRTVEDRTAMGPLTAMQLDDLYVTMDDFMTAIPRIQPVGQREGFATVPGVSWDDIGALHCIRSELTLSVLEPIRHPEKFRALGLSLPAGVLLYGPPGCGKTLLAKAIANESGANFISVKGPELLDKYVGESERAVRVVFERARLSSPCVVFFDELDSLVPKRGGGDSSGGGVSERVVNQLLTEMDGLESRRSVFVIAATNRPELIDPAMLRPGRLDKLLYVPLPSADDRASILEKLAANVQVDRSDVNLNEIGGSPRAEGFSGADCAALLREAGLAVLREQYQARETREGKEVPTMIGSRHFEEAFSRVTPSVTKKDQARYERLRDRISRSRTRMSENDKEES